MFKKNKLLAFIGARAGSKGLKNKNTIDFNGKPLIHWTINASLNSTYIDRTLVSTENSKIAEIAKLSGADVPFLRPPQLSQDDSRIEDAIRHCLHWLKSCENTFYDYIILLQPTSPLRTAQHIDQAIDHYFQHKKTSQDILVSVTRAPQKMGWLMKEINPLYITCCFNEAKTLAQRQKLKHYYLPNGAIYIAPVKFIIKSGFYAKKTLSFLMKEEDSVDIDTPQDLDHALKIFYQKTITNNNNSLL